MSYKNTKEGFKKLYIAAILMLISNCATFFSDTTKQVNLYISIALIIVGIIGYVLNFKGLQLCAQDDSGFNQAYIFSIIGLIVEIVSALVSAIFNVTWLNTCTRVICGFCEFMVVWEVLMTSDYILNKKENVALAKNARVTAYLSLAVFVVTILLSYYNVQMASTGETIVMTIIAVITGIVGIIAEVKYFLFIRQMKDAI